MIRVGQVNVVIRVQLKENGQPLDVSLAQTTIIKLKNPKGTTTAYDASFATDGHDGIITYTTTGPEILDASGPWMLQPFIEMGSDRFHGSPVSFQVGEAL